MLDSRFFLSEIPDEVAKGLQNGEVSHHFGAYGASVLQWLVQRRWL